MKKHFGLSIKVGFESRHFKRVWAHYYKCGDFKMYHIQVVVLGFNLDLDWGLRLLD